MKIIYPNSIHSYNTETKISTISDRVIENPTVIDYVYYYIFKQDYKNLKKQLKDFNENIESLKTAEYDFDSVFHHVIYYVKKEATKYITLLSQYKFDINKDNADFETPLFEAISYVKNKRKQDKLIKTIIDCGGDVNYKRMTLFGYNNSSCGVSVIMQALHCDVSIGSLKYILGKRPTNILESDTHNYDDNENMDPLKFLKLKILNNVDVDENNLKYDLIFDSLSANLDKKKLEESLTNIKPAIAKYKKI